MFHPPLISFSFNFPIHAEHTTITPVSQAQDVGGNFDPEILFVSHVDSVLWHSHICLQHLSPGLSLSLIHSLRHSSPNFLHGLQYSGGTVISLVTSHATSPRRSCSSHRKYSIPPSSHVLLSLHILFPCMEYSHWIS